MNALDTKNFGRSSEGYVTSSTYLRSYIKYQAPCLLSYAAAANGAAVPDYNQPFRYVDLGCGEGVTLILLAGAYPHAQFIGVDMNADHIAAARDLAREAGLTNIEFRCQDFDGFAREETEEYEYVVAHGIMSWVSSDVFDAVCRAVKKVIAPGGLFYFCHYVRPGAGKMETLFHLIADVAVDGETDLQKRTYDAVEYVESLRKDGLPLFRRYPSLEGDIRELLSRDARYLVHEFANQYFTPRFFEDVANQLAGIGLSYAGSSALSRNAPGNLLTDEHAGALDGLDPQQAQVRASLLSHELFRWDVFQRPAEDDRDLIEFEDCMIASAHFPFEYPATAGIVRREVSFDTVEFRFVIDQLTDGTHLISDIIRNGSLSGLKPAVTKAAIVDACAAGFLQPVAKRPHRPTASAGTRYQFGSQTSRAVWDRDFHDEGGTAHVSPVLGAAISLNRLTGRFINALDGATPGEAIQALREELQVLPAKSLKRLGYEDGFNDDEFAKQVQTLLHARLPFLVMYGLVTPMATS